MYKLSLDETNLSQGSEEGTGVETNRMRMHGGCGCYLEHWREGIGSLGNALCVKKQPSAVVEKPLWSYCLFKQSSLYLAYMYADTNTQRVQMHQKSVYSNKRNLDKK